MFSRLLARLVFSLFANTQILHPERTAWRGGCILAANHISHFDPPLLGVAARRKVDWMAMLELFEMPVLGAWLRAIGSFPTDRAHVDRAAVRTALTRVKQGRMVGIFPEGGIRDGARSVLGGAPLKPGVARLAQLAQAPVLPCAIVGSDRFYDPQMWRPFRRVRVWIAFGEPISAPGHLGKEAARDYLERELAKAFRDLFAELRETFALTSGDLPQPPARRKGRTA